MELPSTTYHDLVWAATAALLIVVISVLFRASGVGERGKQGPES